MIASHDPLATEHAERTIGLRDGRMVQESRDGSTSLVIGRGGWVRLPASLQAAAKLGDRVQPRARTDGLLLAPVPGSTASTQAAGPARPLASPEPREIHPARVELTALSRAYRQGPGMRTVLEGLTYSFAPGRLTVVSGRSGSGKTTLLRLIAGLDRPDRGDVELDGQALGAYDDEQLAELRRHRIGVMTQDALPVGFLSAHENVVLVLRLRGWGQDAAARRAAAVLADVGLTERASQRAVRLSAGEGQRLALARALAGARGLLLVDEPTSRLDEANAETVARLLARASAADGQTVICASHDPALVRRADHVLALDSARSSAVSDLADGQA
jgi:ABC-type lipoprotein export system ATPase subunit